MARDVAPDGANPLWRADITYIRLRNEFVYLAVVLGAYSRRVIGWALGRTLEAGLAVSALTMALRQRRPASGRVHHSDRGVQCASYEYTDLLKQHGAQISMSRKGNPYDNAACESFMKTLKYEEVYRSEYRDLADAYAQIREFLERVYNQSGCTRPWATCRLPSLSRTAAASNEAVSTAPCNDLSANGDNPLTFCLTPGVQFKKDPRPPSPPTLASSPRGMDWSCLVQAGHGLSIVNTGRPILTSDHGGDHRGASG